MSINLLVSLMSVFFFQITVSLQVLQGGGSNILHFMCLYVTAKLRKTLGTVLCLIFFLLLLLLLWGSV